jgi:hypothetical protein
VDDAIGRRADLESVSRFATWPRFAAVGTLVFVAALMLFGLWATPVPVPPSPTGADTTKRDFALYNAIVVRVTNGEGYHQAAVDEQRRRGFPLRPFVTVRPPTLTWLIVGVGGKSIAQRVLQALGLAGIVVMIIRLGIALQSKLLWSAAALWTAMYLIALVLPVYWHEAWAAGFILLSIATSSKRFWGVSVAAGLAAAIIRETSAPFLLVMLLMAHLDHRPREVVAWLVAIAIVATLVTTHASNVHALTTLADRSSPGWASSLGWPFILRIMQMSTLLIICPGWVGAILIPLALLGWTSWRHPIASRATLYLGGMIAAFMFVGRANTAYWGMLLASLLPIGLAFAPDALRTLWQRARGRPVPGGTLNA